MLCKILTTQLMNSNLENAGKIVIFVGTVTLALGWPFIETWLDKKRSEKEYRDG